MEYNIQSLSRLSGVSVRTLRYYDEIELLKPLIRMEDGRRYYGTKEFLRLQEILYFKETGLSLKKIKSILAMKHLSKSEILSTQKQYLLNEIDRLKRIVKSVDKTIDHYKKCKMTTEEICEQFESFQIKMKEYETLSEKNFGKEVLDNAREKIKNISKKDMENITERSKNLMNEIIAAKDNNLPEDSEEVQSLMQEHFELSTIFQPMSKEVYLSSRNCLCKESDFYHIYSEQHPDLPEFLYKAMGIFALYRFPE